MLIIANHAHSDGTNAFPSIKTLAKESRMSERQVTRIVQKLEESGELKIGRSEGRVANSYSIQMGSTLTSCQGSTLTSGRPNPDIAMSANPDILSANPDIAMSPKLKNVQELKNKGFEIPDVLATKDFEEAWNTWIEHRKERKPAVTPMAAKMQLKKLASLGVSRAIKAIEHSVAGGYQGLFEPRENASVGNVQYQRSNEKTLEEKILDEEYRYAQRLCGDTSDMQILQNSTGAKNRPARTRLPDV